MDVINKKCVGYYRVSTTQQERSGLGLEAQYEIVNSYCKQASIIASFTDIESGKNNNRPQLFKAIAYANQHDAILVIAKLDRLSRNVSFISNLMDSKVKFVCCDMPAADSFTIHIFAALAQREREFTSSRTKDALKALKARGVKLGNPAMQDPIYKAVHLKKARESRSPKQYDNNVLFIIDQLRQQNKSFEYIAAELTRLNHVTDRKKPYSAVQVFRIYNKAIRGTLSKTQ